MSRHHGGETVEAGFYLNAASWEVTTLSGEGGTLPGAAGERYLRVPTIGLLIFAPLMGALYAIFLPFIGIAMVLQFLAKRAAIGTRDLARSVVGAVSPAWQPGEAAFTGAAARKEEPGAPPTEATKAAPDVEKRLNALEREVERREEGRRS